MARTPNRSLHLHVITSARFIAQLKNMKPNQRAHAEMNYLLCKAAVQRRRLEIEQFRDQGKDTSRLEQMVTGLEASMQAHRRLMGQRPDDC